jgi:CRISPR-associated protein Csy1
MVDQVITTFFDERKAAWLKKNLKASMTVQEVTEKEQECERVFSLKNWLPNAASRAGQITLSTHPCTFSHPSSRKNKNGYASSIIAKSEPSHDGFLKSGNVNVAADALGNAAALDVYKFLTLEMADNKNLIMHFEQDSELVKELVSAANITNPLDYQTIKNGFLAMTTAAEENITSSKIKQVYFPLKKGAVTESADEVTEDDYHQLSVLTASGILFELRKRLDTMRFGDEIKTAREKKKANVAHTSYKEIYNLTTIGYGGTKPQNISVLNNQNGGKAHLFMSMPPVLNQRDIHFPRTDFFNQTVRYFQCKNQFNALHELYKQDSNNRHVRAQRDEYYQNVIDHVIEKMWQVRSVALEQYNNINSQLNAAQTTWLCDHALALRETTDDWLDDICGAITTFLFYGYEKTIGNKAIKFGDAEHKQMKKIVNKNKEALR